jgi:hypothetical protein
VTTKPESLKKEQEKRPQVPAERPLPSEPRGRRRALKVRGW